LSGQSDIELVAQAGSLAEARSQPAMLEFDVVILDLGLPDGNGVDLIADLRRANPDVAVLILRGMTPKAFKRIAYHLPRR